MKRFMGLAAVALLLSGCVVYPDYDRGRGHGHGRGNGEYFCPPGQAKKGNC
nr:hypothetical protein [Comamonas testosteroni]